MDENEKPKAMGQVIQIDGARIRDHLGQMVRGTVEEALNAMLGSVQHLSHFRSRDDGSVGLGFGRV